MSDARLFALCFVVGVCAVILLTQQYDIWRTGR